jgi:UDP-2,4-diacetamido-2,4,6-trideoxy-beta-L-altropyranose hydrolase
VRSVSSQEERVKVAIRTDVSSRIGSGHLVRCLTLAEELRRAGAEVQIVTRPHDVPAADLIRDSGFSFVELPATTGSSDIGDGDYAAWLGVPQEQDAGQTLRALEGEAVDLLIVDLYGVDITWESRLAEACESILVIDDLADRQHAADVLLDQNLRPNGAFAYTSLVRDSCRVLSGPSYALVRQEYVCARRPWENSARASRFLVSLGGVDDFSLIGIIVQGLSELDSQLESVDLVVAEPGLARDALSPLIKALPVRIHGPQLHLADLMSQADMAIGAGGGTTWERLCVGLPSVVTSRAENQRRGTHQLATLGAVVDLGDAAELSSSVVRDAVDGLLASDEQRRRMHELGQALVDGCGRRRVVESIMPTAVTTLTLREAGAQDCGRLWMWANDRTIREQSLDSAAIPWESHVAWFQRVRSEAKVRLLVLEAAGLPVGQLRFDLDGARATMSYSLDACVRRRGWGRRLIELGIDWLRAEVAYSNIELVAVVRLSNRASANVFERLGFAREATTQDGQDVFRFTRALDPGTATG